MEEYTDINENEHKRLTPPAGPNRWLLLSVVALVVVAGVALGYGYRQQMLAGHLAAQQSLAKATIDQMQGQLDNMTAKLNEITAAQAAAKEQEQKAAEKKASAATRPAAKRTARVDKRYKELQARLEEQQKELKETQDLVAKNRSDLEGSLNSTKDELNGSIAKTHEELVALEKRGERNYFEFDLSKSKQFQRVGPISLSLRRTDTKHKNYDLNLIVDDNDLSKKRVNLYEPIWIHAENGGQPVQIVVNHVEKNVVHGYVSAPKYKASELAAASGAVVTPAAAHPQTPDPNSQVPKQPE